MDQEDKGISPLHQIVLAVFIFYIAYPFQIEIDWEELEG